MSATFATTCTDLAVFIGVAPNDSQAMVEAMKAALYQYFTSDARFFALSELTSVTQARLPCLHLGRPADRAMATTFSLSFLHILSFTSLVRVRKRRCEPSRKIREQATMSIWCLQHEQCLRARGT